MGLLAEVAVTDLVRRAWGNTLLGLSLAMSVVWVVATFVSPRLAWARSPGGFAALAFAVAGGALRRGGADRRP